MSDAGFEAEVRRAVYRQVIDTTLTPTVAQTAGASPRCTAPAR